MYHEKDKRYTVCVFVKIELHNLLGHNWHKRPNEERSLGLAQEDVGGGVEGFGRRRSQGHVQQPAQLQHDPLQRAEVEEHRDAEGEKVDDGERLEHEHKVEGVVAFGAVGDEGLGDGLKGEKIAV